MKNLLMGFAVALLVAPAHAVEFKNASGAHVGHASKVQCFGVGCTISGGTATVNAHPRVLASTTALTKAQCGSTVYNSGAVVQPLPDVSDVGTGCRYTFVVEDVSNYDINPNDDSYINLLTDQAGDAIRADAVGESVVLESCNTSEWCPIGAEQGTWSDVN